MNLSLKLTAFLFFLLPFQTWAQSIEANLRYINQQFSIYNEYETSFRVDEAAKLLICEDRFGILKAPFSEVEVRTEGVNVGIFCLNNSEECILSYKKTGERADGGYTDYTMGLGEDGELVPHIQVVMDKFAELKRLVLSSNSGAAATGNLVADVQAELNLINGIFQRSSEYKNVFSVDFATKLITARTQNCRAIFPGDNATQVHYYKRDGSGGYNEGYYIENTNKEVLVSCTSFENYNYKSYEYLNNAADAKRVVQSLNRIIALLSGSSGDASIDRKINEINAIFQRSSEYKNVYSVDFANKQIIGKTENCQVIIPIRRGLSIAAYDRNGTYGNGFFFKNVDKSILESCTSFSDYTEQTYEYVNNASDSRTVINNFNSIINEILGESHSSGNATVAQNLAYINEQFAKYNAYNTRFSINSSGQLVWTHDFGTNYANFKDVEVRTDPNNNFIGVYCLNSSNKCIWQMDNNGNRTDYNSYTMSLKENDKMIPHIGTVIEKFAVAKRLTLGSSMPASGTNAPTDSPD